MSSLVLRWWMREVRLEGVLSLEVDSDVFGVLVLLFDCDRFVLVLDNDRRILGKGEFLPREVPSGRAWDLDQSLLLLWWRVLGLSPRHLSGLEEFCKVRILVFFCRLGASSHKTS